jgi:hypothetical protein
VAVMPLDEFHSIVRQAMVLFIVQYKKRVPELDNLQPNTSNKPVLENFIELLNIIKESKYSVMSIVISY